ncbi:hypothetical protein [Halarcobacter anaerophilus]|uniref:hypothetical protein n=1 Tax=Halarcobacter anaerophilus TaxID=877500 RepID=UPI0005C9517C|nr:hypothetical protein [Halarcobacter anaerophilus]
MTLQERIELLQSYSQCNSLNNKELSNYAYHTLINQEFMPLYTSSTEVFITLAITLLGLSVAFREKVLGQSGRLKITKILLLIWFFLSFAIASGIFYLYAAPKHIEMRFQCDYYAPLGIWPGHVYGMCTISLILGIFLLFILMVNQAKKVKTN